MIGWMFNQAELADDRPVYAIDLPGHGGSSKDVGDGSTRDARRRPCMDLHGRGGHRVGASRRPFARRRDRDADRAAKSPERVAALTLIAPAGLRRRRSPAISSRASSPRRRARKLRPVLEMLAANPELVTADMVEDVLKFKRLDGAIGGAAKHRRREFRRRQAARSRCATGSASSTMPVQVVWGEADRVLPAKPRRRPAAPRRRSRASPAPATSRTWKRRRR